MRKPIGLALGICLAACAFFGPGSPPAVATDPEAASAQGPGHPIRLPERISADELQRLIMDLPGTFDLVDIRPPAHFADYSLPGSRNVDITDLVSNPEYLNGATPLIILDRDGSLAMAVGGILSQKTERPIKVLFGGLEAYWQSLELLPALGVKGAGKGAAAPRETPALQLPAPASPLKPLKKDAGC